LKIKAKIGSGMESFSEKEQSMEFIKYLHKINKELIYGCKNYNKFNFIINKYLDENESIYNKMDLSKTQIEFPKEEEVFEIYQKLCKSAQVTETQCKDV